MRREDFIEETQFWDWNDAMSYCWNNGYDSLAEDYYSPDARDEYIENDLPDMIRGCTWREVRDSLSNLEDSDSYYYWRYDYYGDWVGLDDGDDLQAFIDQLIENMDEDGAFDEEEDEDELPEAVPVFTEPVEEESPFASEGDLNTYFYEAEVPRVPAPTAEELAALQAEAERISQELERQREYEKARDEAFKTAPEPTYKAMVEFDTLWD